MIQLSFVSKTEIPSFKDGAIAQAAFIYDDVKESDFRSNDGFSKALDIYENSAIHHTILKDSEILSNNVNEYNKADISIVMDDIANMDADLYQMVIHFIHAALQQKDINSRKEYFNYIKNIVYSEEANTKATTDEAVNENIPDDMSEAMPEEVNVEDGNLSEE